MKRIYFMIITVFSLVLFSCEKDTEKTEKRVELPSVVTDNVTNISETNATCGGEVKNDGGLEVTERGLVLGTYTNPTITDNVSIIRSGSGLGTFNSDLSELETNTVYYIRAYAINDKGTAYGSQKEFTTLKYQPKLPTVKTLSVTDITFSDANCEVEVTDDGGLSISARGCVYGIYENPTIETNEGITKNNSGTGAFVANLSNLKANTDYYVRAYATNNDGTVYGTQIKFTTLQKWGGTLNPNDLTKVLIIPNSNLLDGNMPKPTNSNESPVMTMVDTTISYSAGSQVKLPLNFSSNSGGNVSGLRCQIVGASKYYDVPVTPTNNGTMILPISIPENVQNGSFTVLITIYDASGNVSNSFKTLVNVTSPLYCNVRRVSGGEGITSTLHNMGSNPGFIKIDYQTYTVPDRIDVFYNGDWVAGTGSNPGSLGTVPPLADCNTPTNGYVGEQGAFCFQYNPGSNYNFVEVVVSGCIRGGTLWYYDISCASSENACVSLPSLTTRSITNIETSTAVSGGNISDNGGASILERGVCWSTSQNPTINDNKTIDGSGTGSFTSNLTGLAAHTSYYVRAYATNSEGTAYGDQVTFITNQQVNLNLNDKWVSDYGLVIQIRDANGYFYSFNSGWQSVANKGLVAIGDRFLKNINQISTKKWTCLRLWTYHENGITLETLWSDNGTITMSDDGNSISVWSSVNDYKGQSGSDTSTFYRQSSKKSLSIKRKKKKERVIINGLGHN